MCWYPLYVCAFISTIFCNSYYYYSFSVMNYFHIPLRLRAWKALLRCNSYLVERNLPYNTPCWRVMRRICSKNAIYNFPQLNVSPPLSVPYTMEPTKCNKLINTFNFLPLCWLFDIMTQQIFCLTHLIRKIAVQFLASKLRFGASSLSWGTYVLYGSLTQSKCENNI